MPRQLTIFAIALSYFLFAILLNSVGTVILQSIASFDISKPQASTLEGFKDLSIAIVSFCVASLIPRVGYKLAMLAALLLVGVACLFTPLLANFVAIKILFACVGTAFALVKVSVYAVIGQLTDDAKGHSALLNTIEGIFMLGVLSGYWIFSAFIDANNPQSTTWLNVYYLLAALVAIVFVCVLLARFDKPPRQAGNVSPAADFVNMLKLAYQPLVLIFILSIFLYVLIEQGIGTWLPTFNNEVLHLPVTVSVQLTSIFAIALAIGRLLAGQLLRYIDWFPFLLTSLALMATLILLTLPLVDNRVPTEVSSVFDAPLAAYLLPLIGLLMAPVYPIINSVMLSTLDRSRHAAMTGLIVVFSALGGTTGSIITGLVFDAFGGKQAFYLLLLPVVGVGLTLYGFQRLSRKLADVRGACHEH